MDQQSNQENAESRSPSSGKPNGYSQMLEKFVEIMKTQYADVKFCFDCDGDVVKLPTHKGVLAASSPVFDAMFNGELKEKGDVEINDASPIVFEEFLHFFYGKTMKLSMENVTGLLTLADKYDVKDCHPICIDFLKENLSIDAIVWGLHLALRFQLEDLKEHCMNEIDKNFEKVWNMFDVKDDGTVQLLSNPDDRFLSEKDIEGVYRRILAMSKNIISKLTAHVDRLCDGRVITYNLVKDTDKQTKVMITEHEIIRFELTNDLMLTDLFCSDVFEKKSNGSYGRSKIHYKIKIGKKHYYDHIDIVFSKNIYLDNEYHVKLTDPILISSGYMYFVIMKSRNVMIEDRYTYRAALPTEYVVLTPTVKISFPYRGAEGRYTSSLISRMYFAPILKK